MRLSRLRSVCAAAVALLFLSCSDNRPLDPASGMLSPTPEGSARLSTSTAYPEILISQVYGGGGNSGATYTHDFVELFNPGEAPVEVGGWRVSYASATGTSWSSGATLPAGSTIEPGGYYLIQMAAGAGGTTPLPAPDATGTAAMSATAGKVVLARTATAPAVACPEGPDIVDLVPYGSTANCSNPTATLTNTTAALRNGDGCAYTGSASADFSTGPPNPRNSASPTNPCGGGDPEPPAAPVASVTVSPAAAETTVGAALQFTAQGFDAEGNPATTTFTWASSDPGVATIDLNTGLATAVAEGYTIITATAASEVPGTTTLTVGPRPPSPPLMITEIMADPTRVNDNMGEWFEIFNNGDEPVDLLGYQLRSFVNETHTIAASVVVPAQGFVVLGNNADQSTNGGVPVDYSYGNTSSIVFNNSNTDWLTLKMPDGTLVDSVSYSARDASGAVVSPTYSPTAGRSRAVIDLNLDRTLLAGSNWRNATNDEIYGLGDFGTPGYGPYGPATPVATVTVSPSPASVVIERTRQFTATARDEDGRNTTTTFTWSSSNNAVATIDESTGLATGVALGTATITATAENGVTGTSTLTVTETAEVASIALGINDPREIPVGFTKPAFPTVRDGDGVIISPPPPLVWSSSNEAAAEVDQLGYITGRSVGFATITATAENGVSGSNSVTILPGEAPTSAVYRNHVEFGIPSDGTPGDDHLMHKPQFSLSYNSTRGGPNWVSWNLNATQFGAVDRCNCFTADQTLPDQFYKVVDFDYRNGGYDRGHMVQSFSRTTTMQENAATFLLTNILPQAANNNQGPWAAFENYTNDLVRLHGKEIYVIAGGEYSANPATLKDEGKVQVPEFTWKIAVILQAGQGLADVQSLSDLEVIAVRMPNDTLGARDIRNHPWEIYQTTVHAIERATGYDFLHLLPDAIERYVENGMSYTFEGFFRPVENLPVFNRARAGSAVPVKFSLGADYGLDIFAAGFPSAGVTACDSSAPVIAVDETANAGGSSLTYDAATGQYSYVWKTESGWAGSCRQLVVKLNDGKEYRANFQFTR